MIYDFSHIMPRGGLGFLNLTCMTMDHNRVKNSPRILNIPGALLKNIPVTSKKGEKNS